MLKRGRGKGFSGVDNDPFVDPKASMLFCQPPASNGLSISVSERRGVRHGEIDPGGGLAAGQLNEVVVDRVLAGDRPGLVRDPVLVHTTHIGWVGARVQHLLQEFFGRA